MIDRRELLTLGGLLGIAPAPENGEGAAVGAGQMTDRQVHDLVDAINNVKSLIEKQQSFSEINDVRKVQYTYLRGNSKFPDFIDIGSDVWLAIYDWHIRLQQPLVLGRDNNGRYTMMLGFTTLVLRPDWVPTVIGIPYDQR
jgi:hypothetical protein